MGPQYRKKPAAGVEQKPPPGNMPNTLAQK
jgi:hypothetical protein